MHQKTLKHEVEFSGIEPFGGCIVNVRLLPAEPNTGVVYRIPFRKKTADIPANLNNLKANRYTLILEKNGARVLNVEHFNAAFYAYGLSNVIVEMERVPSKSYILMQKFHVAASELSVPNLAEREKTLCNIIDKTGLDEQDEKTRIIRVRGNVVTPKLSFYHKEGPLRMEATTDYHVPGEEKFSTDITADAFRDEISRSRPYVKYTRIFPQGVLNIAGCIANTSHGIGHGITENAFFYPPKTLEEWRRYEWKPAEIARHTIVDRLGALMLLEGEIVDTLCTAHFSNHMNDCRVLKTYREMFC